MNSKIIVDFSEQISKTENKIDTVRRLMSCIESQEAALYLKNEPVDKKVEFGLAITESTFGIRTSVNISAETLIPILEQNIKDNTTLVIDLAKELGIEVRK